MSNDHPRLPYELSSPRGPAPATPWNPYGTQWAEDAEPEIDVMEYVRLICTCGSSGPRSGSCSRCSS
jgi:hypothetical protein